MSVPLILALLASAPACLGQDQAIYSTRWEFGDGAEGWTGSGMEVAVEEGILRATIGRRDSWVTGPKTEIEAARNPFIEIRLRALSPDVVQGMFYWRTDVSSSWAAPPKNIAFPLMPGGEWHTYRLRVGSPRWTGKILQLRFDPEPANAGLGLGVEVDFVRVYGLAWESAAHVETSRIAVGERTRVETTARALNRRLADAQATIELPDELALAEGGPTQDLGSIDIGQERSAIWEVRARVGGQYRIGCRIGAEGVTSADRTVELLVTAPDPLLDGDRPERAMAATLDGGHVVLSNSRVRLVFVRSGESFVHALLEVWDDGWRRMGSAYPLGEAVWRDADASERRLLLGPGEARVSVRDGEAAVVLGGVQEDLAGGRWEYELRASLADGSPDCRLRAGLRCSRDRRLLRFAGPMLRLGEGSFGAAKDEAMLPGLEWLVGGERSSSTLDLAPPANMRYVPHPYKVTVPLMCVEAEGRVAGLAWDPLQKWDGENTCPLAEFCSPNWINGGRHHLMGLFTPSTPGWVIENDSRARRPYELAGGQELGIESTLVTGTKTTCLQTVWRYLDLFGEFRAQPPPMTDEEEMALADETYMKRLWKPEDASWIYCFPFSRSKGQPITAANHYFSRFALALWTDSLLRESPQSREAVRSHVLAALEGAYRGGGEWYLDPQLAFRAGRLREAMLGEEHDVQATLAAQQPDGSWGGFHPTSKTEGLGPPGARAVGLCSKQAAKLLRYARLTANREALDAGLRAVEYMDRFSVPRAAQTWECPVHSPDIYAAYAAIMPCIEAYRITGEQRYLDRAVYWAETGLPFVYVWGARDRPVMKGGSIAIFGGSFFTCNWIGRPVQWNGMEYSWALLQLAEYDHSRPWVELATSIMRSGMWQQEKDDSIDAKGGYTDNWDLPTDRREPGFVLSPWWILLNLHTLRGFDPAVRTQILPTPGGAIHVSSGARVQARLDEEELSIALQYAPGEDVYCLVAGIARPDTVLRGGAELPEVEDLGEAAQGWTYLPERAFLLIRARPTEGDNTALAVPGARAAQATWELGSVPRPPYRTLRQIKYDAMPLEIVTDWDFATEDAATWESLSHNDMAPPKIEDGMLTISVTGPDPYLFMPIDELDAQAVKVITVEMAVDRGEQFEVYFATADDPNMDERKSVFTGVHPDGAVRKYTARVGDHALWTGTIRALRFDPVGPVSRSHIGARVRVRRIVLSNKPL